VDKRDEGSSPVAKGERGHRWMPPPPLGGKEIDPINKPVIKHLNGKYYHQNAQKPTILISKTVCQAKVGVATVNLCTKFEVCMFIHYEDTKGHAKCRNWGGLGVDDPQDYRQHKRSIQRIMTHCATLIETIHHVYLEPFSSYSVDFSLPYSHLSLPLGTTPFEIRRYIQRLLCDPKFSRFDTIPECDRHIHKHTDTWRQHIHVYWLTISYMYVLYSTFLYCVSRVELRFVISK